MVCSIGDSQKLVISQDPVIIEIDSKKLQQEEAQLQACLKKHPKGYVIVIFKSSRLLYLAEDGRVVENKQVKKSELDPEYAFLKGKPEDEIVITFPVSVALGHNPIGPRARKFDKKTPEGEYFVCRKNARGQTKYTVGLEISYPNLEDAEKALKAGRITRKQFEEIESRLKRWQCPPYNTTLGGYIKIHGPANKTMKAFKKDNPEAYREFLRVETPDSQYFTDEDWTFGCLAVELSSLFYLYRVVQERAPVIIYP